MKRKGGESERVREERGERERQRDNRERERQKKKKHKRKELSPKPDFIVLTRCRSQLNNQIRVQLLGE